MTTREAIISAVIVSEGGFTDHPDDSGGATNYGITESLAREYGYQGDMEALPLEVALYIYTREFWGRIQGDEMLSISPGVVSEVFDTAVHGGTFTASQMLQTSLNLLNNKGQLYADIEEDGIIGAQTLLALRQYLRFREELVLLTLLNCLQGALYASLATRREKDETFLYGWIKNRVRLGALARPY